MLGRSLPAATSAQIRSEAETVDGVESVVEVVTEVVVEVVTEAADWATTEP